MSIKTSISLFILMMGFSFSVHSQSISYILLGKKQFASSPQAGADAILNSYCSYVPSKRKYQGATSVSVFANKFSVSYMYYKSEGCTGTTSSPGSFAINYVYESCPDGQEINDITQFCEAVCEPPSVLDPDTLECVIPPFCERESTNDALFAAEQACAAEGGIFSFECSDFLETLETRCTQSNECAIGFPNWPACLDDLDPTDDITPPSGGFDPSNPPTANPDAPSFDKPEPDDVTPTDTTDEAVLKAIQNANRDSNAGFKALSIDLNNGFTDTNNALSKLNSTNTAIGESVVEQMNQDYQIFQANKDLALQQTGAINAGASDVVDALGSQTGKITDAIGDLASKLPVPCEPDASNNFCENPHTLNTSYIGDIFTQMDVATTEAVHDDNDKVEGFIQDVIGQPLTNEGESIMNDATSHLLGLLDYNQSCRALSFEANGRSYSIDCQVSSQIKLVLAFLIGMYTVMTLIDILLDGIVPLGSKPSATRYS